MRDYRLNWQMPASPLGPAISERKSTSETPAASAASEAAAPAKADPFAFLSKLAPNERYAGLIVGHEGKPAYHVILIASSPNGHNFASAREFAEQAGGVAPRRRELALLFANLADQFEPTWYWSDEEEGSSFAWLCYFISGHQHYGLQSYEGGAVAVRRVIA